MNTKHTRGTWYEAKMGNDHQGLVVDEQTGANVAVVYEKANARLIAAAPDLLEALEGLVPMTWNDGPLCEVYREAGKKAEAAIAKAIPQ